LCDEQMIPRPGRLRPLTDPTRAPSREARRGRASDAPRPAAHDRSRALSPREGSHFVAVALELRRATPDLGELADRFPGAPPRSRGSYESGRRRTGHIVGLARRSQSRRRGTSGDQVSRRRSLGRATTPSRRDGDRFRTTTAEQALRSVRTSTAACAPRDSTYEGACFDGNSWSCKAAAGNTASIEPFRR